MDDQEIAGHVRREAAERLYLNLPTALFTVAITAGLAAWELATVAPLSSVATWIVACLAVCAARLADLVSYRRRPVSPARAERRFLVGALLNGSVWGASALLLDETLTPAVVVVFIIGGLAAGASSSSASSLPAFLAYTLPALLPVVGRLAYFGTRAHLVMAGALTLFCIALTLLTRRAGRSLVTDLRLRLENETLVQEVRRTSAERVSRLRRLLDRAGVAFLVAELDTLEIVDCSENTGELFGPTPAEISGRSLDELSLSREHTSKDFWRELIAACRQKPATRSVGSLEVVVSVCEVAGRNYVLVIARDVSERLVLESQLAESSLLASLGSLAAGVAHEINNPLSYILTNLTFVRDALTQQGGHPDQLAALSDTLEGAHRIERIVRDLTATVRLDQSSAEDSDVESLLESVVHMCDHELRHRAQVVKVLRAVPRVQVPAPRLTQVLLNLVLNAAQAIPEGDVSSNVVELETEYDPAHGRVRIFVRDTGVGIPGAHLPRIFEPFFTTKPPGSSRGLGLSICHRLVRDMGGVLSVKSSPGEGSEFLLELPAAAELQAHPPTTALPREEQALRVIAVDDDERVLTALRRLLHDHDVATFTAARDALEYLEREATASDVILCDVMMPHMNGPEFVSELERRRPELAQRLAFITGGVFAEEIARALALRSQPVLSKPFQRSTLLKTLRALQEGR